MQQRLSETSHASGGGYAFVGVALMVISGLFLAQAGGSDRETFLAVGFALGAVGLLFIVIGGIAIGVRMARD